jgi:predicted amidohydrolase
MKIAMLQFDPSFGETNKNLDRIQEALTGRSADLVVLPELCTTGYQFIDRAEAASLAEPADGKSAGRLAEIAGCCQAHLVAGFAEKSGGKIFNSAILVSSQGTVGVYRKVHLFSEEKNLFAPGDLGFRVFPVGNVPVGIMICFDWIFPESARSLSTAGAWVIAHPANLVLPFCQSAMVTRALENRVFTVTCNRTGQENRVEGISYRFTGSSRMVAPDGTVLAQGAAGDTEVISVEIDPDLAGNKQITKNNHILEDRRPDQYRLS